MLAFPTSSSVLVIYLKSLLHYSRGFYYNRDFVTLGVVITIVSTLEVSLHDIRGYTYGTTYIVIKPLIVTNNDSLYNRQC